MHVREKEVELGNQHLQSGVDRLKLREYFTAIEDFQTALKYNPDLWVARRYKGDAEFQLGQLENAINDYNSVLIIMDDTLSYFGRAEARRMSDNSNLALVDYNKAIELSGKNYAFHFGRGECYLNLEQYDNAIKDFDDCILLQPNFKSCYSKRAFAFFKMRSYRKSIKDFNQYFKLGGSQSASYYYRGASYLNLNSIDVFYADSAIGDYIKFEQLGGQGKSYDGLGASYALKGDSSNARKYFRMAIERDPNDSEAYSLWGKSELNLGSYKKALDLFNKQKSLVQGISSDLFYCLAMANLGLCDLARSLDYFEKSIEVDSLNQEAYKGRVGLTFRSQKSSENIMTVNDLTHLLKLSKDKIWSSMLLASRSFIELRLGDLKSARTDIDSAMVISSPNAILYMLRGIVKLKNHEVSSSIALDYDAAIESDGVMWQPWLLKSYFYYEQKDKRQSCNSLKKAIANGAAVDKRTEQYLCNGKSGLEKNGAAFESILSDLLLRSILNKGALAVECDNN